MSIPTLLDELKDRLPELEWQLQKLNCQAIRSLLPPGLFNTSLNNTFDDYIHEIKEDIKILSRSKSSQAQQYLATKIDRKVNILVKLCHQKPPSNPTAPKKSVFEIDSILTRGQWIQKMSDQVQQLTTQKIALLQANANPRLSTASRLNLQHELGLIEKRLTLAEEAYHDATGQSF